MMIYFQSPKALNKYVALYAAHLIKDGGVVDAMRLYVRYGSPAAEQNFNIYKRIFQDVLAMPDTNTAKAYSLWAGLRDMLLDLVRRQSFDRN